LWSMKFCEEGGVKVERKRVGRLVLRLYFS
jgi:hypothetical protein